MLLGPLVIEANISPGPQGLGEVSTLDLPDQIARFLHRKTEESLQSGKKNATDNVLKDLKLDTNEEPSQKIITHLQFRGERILLPEWVARIAKFNELKDYIVHSKKGKIEIEEM